MKYEIAINRSLTKRNPLIFPRDPIAPTAPPECEAYALGHDARMDGKPIDKNPYHNSEPDHVDWNCGWADADRALDEDEEMDRLEGED
jgi:hypothetical protein